MRLSTILDDIRGIHRYATVDDIRKVFGDYHNALRWLAVFLIGDEKIADACIVDACNIAQTRGPIFHEWLVEWAARATVRCVFQSQRVQIAQLAPEYEKNEPGYERHSPLSAECFRLLIHNYELIQARLDVLCRFVLVLRGIGKDSYEAVAAQLGISRIAGERAYSVAYDTLGLIQREARTMYTLRPSGYTYDEGELAPIDERARGADTTHTRGSSAGTLQSTKLLMRPD